MPYVDYFKKGAWNFICEVCGQRYKSTEMKKRWDGVFVCPKDFEYRQPQDFVKGVRDIQSTPWSRPEVYPDNFTGPNPPNMSITVGLSPFSIPNTFPYPVTVNITGGTVSNISLNGTTVATSTNFSITVQPYGVLTVTYSVAPTMSYYNGIIEGE